METRLKVTGMTCNHCVEGVTRALTQVPGVEEVQVVLEGGLAVVRGTVDRAALVAAVIEEGYETV